MKIAGLLCMLAACGDNVPYRGVYGVGAGEPVVGALVQVQEVRAIAPPPDMAREPRRVRREREVVVEVGAWRLAGAGTLQGAELRTLPTADTCREHALAYGGPGAAADYLWREAARMEVVVPLPTPQPEDLRIVPVVELEAVGRAASFAGPDGWRCTEPSRAAAEWHDGTRWRAAWAERGTESAEPQAPSLRLRVRAHGDTHALVRRASVWLTWTEVEP